MVIKFNWALFEYDFIYISASYLLRISYVWWQCQYHWNRLPLFLENRHSLQTSRRITQSNTTLTLGLDSLETPWWGRYPTDPSLIFISSSGIFSAYPLSMNLLIFLSYCSYWPFLTRRFLRLCNLCRALYWLSGKHGRSSTHGIGKV